MHKGMTPKMIYISHTHPDKPVVEPISQIADIFGQENVFYDAWSIQPGDGIIDKINQGLSKCKFFFFFVSKNSLSSNMVKLEWQTALYKATNNQITLVPVKIDNCLMPDILLQTMYIDFYTQGPEVALRQIIDVVKGNNTYKKEIQEFQNIRGYISAMENGCKIEFRAEIYMEPQSHFAIGIENDENEINYSFEGIVYPTRFVKDWKLDASTKTNFLIVQRANATSPGFPFVVKLTSKVNSPLKVNGLFHAVSSNQVRAIPVIQS